MSDLRTIALDITLDGRRADSETICTWAGPYVLVIATVLPEAGLAFDVHSTFVGHEGVPQAGHPARAHRLIDPARLDRQ